MRHPIIAMAAVLTTITSNPVNAQTELTSPALREECRSMAAALRAGPGDSLYEYARDLIHRCDESGGRALADRWTMVTGEDPLDLAQLRGRSREFRDRDLLSRVIELVQDQMRDAEVRLALLEVLVSYYAPGRGLFYSIRDPEMDPTHCILGSSSHFRSRESADPIRREERPLILRVVEAVATGEEDGRVRHAAACALNGMRLVG